MKPICGLDAANLLPVCDLWAKLISEKNWCAAARIVLFGLVFLPFLAFCNSTREILPRFMAASTDRAWYKHWGRKRNFTDKIPFSSQLTFPAGRPSSPCLSLQSAGITDGPCQASCLVFLFLFFFCFSKLGMEFRTLCMVAKCSTTELYSQQENS